MICLPRSSYQHSPDNPQIRGNRITVPPPGERHPFRGQPMARFRRSVLVWNAICLNFPSSRRTSPIVFTSPWIAPAYAGAGLRRNSSIPRKISRNKFRGPPLYVDPSCSPWVGLTLLSMSRMILVGGCRSRAPTSRTPASRTLTSRAPTSRTPASGAPTSRTPTSPLALTAAKVQYVECTVVRDRTARPAVALSRAMAGGRISLCARAGVFETFAVRDDFVSLSIIAINATRARF